MKPTRIGTLVTLLVCIAAVTWGVLQISVDRGATLPPLTWTAPAGIALIAVVVLATALGLRARLDQPAKRPHPLSMARMAVLGKASAHVGPIVGGLYAGYLLVLLPGLEISARRDRAVLCLVALLASVALSVAGLLLERACRVPPSSTDDQLPTAPA
jgi:Protein of unknown function (DUF3180)